MSATYIHSSRNPGSLTHWARPGTEPETSWFLVRFVSAEPWQELWEFFLILLRSIFQFSLLQIMLLLSSLTLPHPRFWGFSPCLIFENIGGGVENALSFLFFCFFFFPLFRAAPVACGSSQNRGQIGATAASLHHSHSNIESKPCLQPTSQLMATPDP